VNFDSQYLNSMTLPKAVKPADGVLWEPYEGYRVRVFRDRRTGVKMPMLTAAVSSDRAFDTFIALTKPLGDVVHTVLESSHNSDTDFHNDFRRSHIDAPVLKSYLYEFEDLIVNDGCTGVAVMSVNKAVEVQFDEHKIITVYAPDTSKFRRILRSMGIQKKKDLTVVAEAEHLHYTTISYAESFRDLAIKIGAGQFSDHCRTL
jgi:hypothetical protein